MSDIYDISKEANSIDNLQSVVEKMFVGTFGSTPLNQRLEDIFKQATKLSRSSNLSSIEENLGHLLSSTFQLANESQSNVEDLIYKSLSVINRRSQQYKTLGRKKEIALLGGAFDPITKGHEEIANFVLNSSGIFDEVWFMPCGDTHIYGKKMASTENRLAMCSLVCFQNRRTKVSSWEIDRDFGGETYSSIKALLDSELAETYNFSLIIGMDNANTFDKWVNYWHLERLIRFVVVPRKGVKTDNSVDWYLKHPHVFLQPDNDIRKISSSEMRDALRLMWRRGHKDGSSLHQIIEDNLDPEVINFIKRKNLYKDS